MTSAANLYRPHNNLTRHSFFLGRGASVEAIPPTHVDAVCRVHNILKVTKLVYPTTPQRTGIQQLPHLRRLPVTHDHLTNHDAPKTGK